VQKIVSNSKAELSKGDNSGYPTIVHLSSEKNQNPGISPMHIVNKA